MSCVVNVFAIELVFILAAIRLLAEFNNINLLLYCLLIVSPRISLYRLFPVLCCYRGPKIMEQKIVSQ